MKKTIYHGSTDIIIKPEYGKGSIKNDYGRGFYCTEEIELAKEWACGNDTDGYANKYEIDLNKLNTLYLNSDEYSILNWLAILTRFRTYWQSSSIAEEAKQYLQDNFYIFRLLRILCQMPYLSESFQRLCTSESWGNRLY